MRDFIREHGKVFVIPVVLIIVLSGLLIFQLVTRANVEPQYADFKEIEKVQELEKAAEQEKTNKPYVTVIPARTVETVTPTSQTNQAPEQSITQQEQQGQIQNKPAAASSSLPTYDNPTPKVKVEPQQEPAAASTPAPTPTPKTIETRKAILNLSADDIKHLQSYPMRSTVGGKTNQLFQDFETLYAEEKDSCELLMTKFSPVHLYANAKVKWLTNPHLVYYSAIGQYCIRGIIDLTYYNSNSFNLEPNQRYQREVEYRIDYSLDKNGKPAQTLEETVYLSDFYKVVE